MRLTLVITALSGGGAARIMAILADYFQKQSHQVTVVTLSGSESDFYPLPAGVERVALGLTGQSPTWWHALLNNGERLSRLRHAIQSSQPEVVISFVDQMNVQVLLALRGTRIPVIVSERIDPQWLSCPPVWRVLRRFLYPFADVLVSISSGIDRGFQWLPSHQRVVIPNPIADVDAGSSDNPAFPLSPQRHYLIGMGRLSRQKGFDLLIEAFSPLAKQFPDWDLVLLGEGEAREALAAQIASGGLESRIHLPGVIREPFPILRRSDIFVLSSRAEGFVNALTEAMACGLPAISFDCPGSPAEVIRHDVNGLLVPPGHIQGLSSAMQRLMSEPETRRRLATEAVKVRSRFSSKTVFEEWDALLTRVRGVQHRT